MTRQLFVVALAAGLLASPAAAQQPAQRRVDSLAAQVRALKARLDSLSAVLSRTQGAPAVPGAKDTGTTTNELTALRAAAAAAAGLDTIKADTLTPTKFVGRERSQPQLNPEVSVTGDVRAYAQPRGVQRDNFDPREFEIGFQSAMDPYSYTKVFVSLEGGEVSIEEGYAYWAGLPGRIRLDVGKFRQQWGELNRWHLHALPESEYPLALTMYLGSDGLSGTGVSLYRAFGGFGTHEITAQVTRSASDDELFGGGRRPSYLAHVLNFWQLSPATYIQVGATGLYGTNPDSSLRTRLGGLEFRFTWRPPARAMYRTWTVRGELLALNKAYGGTGTTRFGGFVSTTYKLNVRFVAGARYDYVEAPGTGLISRQIMPSLTLWESEWVYLRAQYRWQKIGSTTPTHQLALQAVWAIGPHRHETY